MLILPKKGLKGIISRSLGCLDKLKLLDLSCNHFVGVLPAELSNLKQLQVLDLSHNMLTGRVSPVLSGLKMIQSLNVSSNSFSGDLWGLAGAWGISKSSCIQRLDNCSSSLKELHVDVYLLSGELPNVFGNLTNLEFFIAHSNSFSGSLPSSLGLCSKLHVLDLQNYSLTGSIDLNFTRLTSLCMLDLASNHFSRPLPNSLADCHQLKILSLAKNGFAGQVSSFPPSISLSNNMINGTIPPEVGLWKQLHAEMQNLEYLDLSSNDLIGSIPKSFEKLTFLSKFSVAYIHLRGEIPTGGQFYTFPASSFEGNSGLCREIDFPCGSSMVPKPIIP
ncbi:hypothetical protein Q3G72_007717 [Acer saccharum]|nr:hypothetical protein Q3G72_007717 [Acer saccharum]